MAEQNFRQAMTISQGDLSTFVTRPISLTLLLLAVLALLAPRLWSWWRSRA
jgi:putative tricarboxylic transport membrane protein